MYIVPPPTLAILPLPTSVYAGSFITVSCSIQLSNAVDRPVTVTAVWRRDGALLTNSANRMVLDVVQVSNSSLYLAQIELRPVQLMLDDGVYSCEVSVDTDLEFDEFIMSSGLIYNSTNIILNALGMYKSYFMHACVVLMKHMHKHTVPTLTAMMQPQAETALDIPPFNTLVLRCIARAPDSVLLQKSFEWQREAEAISDNNMTIVISYPDTNMPQSISELTLTDLSIGIHTFFCTVNMSIPGGVDITVRVSGVVTIKGTDLLSRPTYKHSLCI